MALYTKIRRFDKKWTAATLKQNINQTHNLVHSVSLVVWGITETKYSLS